MTAIMKCTTIFPCFKLLQSLNQIEQRKVKKTLRGPCVKTFDQI